MPSASNLSPTTIPTYHDSTPLTTTSLSCLQHVEHFLHSIWKSLPSCCSCTKAKSTLHSRSFQDKSRIFSVQKKIISLIEQIAIKDQAYQQEHSIELKDHSGQEMISIQAVRSHRARQKWISSIKEAFTTSMMCIAEAKLDPTNLPKEIALPLTDILWRFGHMLYGNKEAPHPFQSSLDVLKVAILMLEHALGLSPSCPDLSNLHSLEDLYILEHLRQKHSAEAESAIDRMDANAWSEKAILLNQQQLFLILQILRFTNGAMRFLDQVDFHRCGNLLDTAESCLLNAEDHSKFDIKEVHNQFAELVYNDLTSFTAAKAQFLEVHGRFKEARELWERLDGMWDVCEAFSSDQEKMHARCNNNLISRENCN